MGGLVWRACPSFKVALCAPARKSRLQLLLRARWCVWSQFGSLVSPLYTFVVSGKHLWLFSWSYGGRRAHCRWHSPFRRLKSSKKPLKPLEFQNLEIGKKNADLRLPQGSTTATVRGLRALIHGIRAVLRGLISELPGGWRWWQK